MFDADQDLACGQCRRLRNVGKLEDDSRVAESSDLQCTHSAPPVSVMAEFDEVATGERTPGLLQAATRSETAEIDRREAETLDELFDEGGRFEMVTRDEDHATSSVLHRPFIEAGGDDRIERLDTVLRAVTRDVLDPEVVREALDLAVRDLEQPAIAGAARLDTLK